MGVNPVANMLEGATYFDAEYGWEAPATLPMVRQRTQVDIHLTKEVLNLAAATLGLGSPQHCS